MRTIIALLLISMLLLTACNLSGNAVKETSSCISLSGTAKDDCYLEEKKCSRIESVQTRDSCVADLAEIKKDIAVCDLITTLRTKYFCQEKVAEATNDHNLCNQIKEDEYWQNNCHFNLT